MAEVEVKVRKGGWTPRLWRAGCNDAAVVARVAALAGEGDKLRGRSTGGLVKEGGRFTKTDGCSIYCEL